MVRENRKEGDEDYDIYYPIDDALEGKPFDEEIQQFWDSIELPKTHAELQLKLREMNQDTIKIQQTGPSVVANRKPAAKSSKLNIRLTNKHKSEDLRKILNIQYDDG
uniref:8-amino-7-oxononanoate synthase n=1 Tax=Lygus hesperus TaxID=30085 RepID=A0A0A9XG35_LYGHE